MRESLKALVEEALAGLVHLKKKRNDPKEGYILLNEYSQANPMVETEVVDGITYHHIHLNWMHDGHNLKAHLVTNGNAFNFPEIYYNDVFKARHCELFLRSKKLIANPLQEDHASFKEVVTTLQPLFNKMLEII